jgi:DNA-binding transcriptional ArsR family regulator
MFNEFVQWLQSQGVPLRPTNNGFLTLCPAHSDSQPSLSISEGNNGRVLLYCFAQCDYRAIADAFVRQGANPAWFGLSPRVTLSDLAQGDRQLLATLQVLGCVEQDSKVGFPVTYADGSQGFHFRVALDGKGKWKHQTGGKASEAVFALHHERVQQAIARCQAVIVTESPLDAATLLAASKWTNLPAISVLGKGNAKALSADLHRQVLSDAIGDGGTIFVWVEPDANGFAQAVADALQRPVKAISAPDAERKDAYRLWLALNKDWNAFAQAIHDLAAQVTEVTPQQSTLSDAPQDGNAPQKERPTCPFCQLSEAELFEHAKPVLDADNPLQAAVDRVSQTFGVVGENDNLQLLLLALTTRIFPQPVNVLVVGGTGQGKSFLTDAACATLPPCCHRRIVGASARALLFHPLAKGTVLQWLELPELGGDTIAATILRSILWQAPQEVTTDYLFVEWTPKGARRRSVQIPRQVALITTKVDLPKDDQLLSRFLVMEVRESPDKRRAVLSALAASFNGVPSSPTDDALEPVRAFAEWLGRVQARVTIPYAHALADLFAELPASERDYRDFATLLKLIAACALWNLAKRQHAFDGDRLHVTADLADYATVYRLLLPVWGKPRSAALSETERRVAEALKESDHPATAEELAKVTDIPDRSIRRILKSLADKGIAERGEKRGRSHEWRLVGDLDAFTATLPTPEAVAAAWQPDPDPTPENVSRKMFHGQTVIHGHEGLTAKNPSSIGTFGVTVKRSSETIHTAHSTTLHDHDKASENFSPVADADSLKNRDRDDREAKNPSGTSTFGGQPPLTANDRDDRDDRHDRDLPDPESGLEVKVTCPRCGAWRRVPPDAFMLTDPRCPVCGEVMRLEPEGDPPTDPADPPLVNAPTDLTKPLPRPSSRLPDGVACQCGGRLRAVGREYLCDRCQRPLPAACKHCYRVLLIVAEG